MINDRLCFQSSCGFSSPLFIMYNSSRIRHEYFLCRLKALAQVLLFVVVFISLLFFSFVVKFLSIAMNMCLSREWSTWVSDVIILKLEISNKAHSHQCQSFDILTELRDLQTLGEAFLTSVSPKVVAEPEMKWLVLGVLYTCQKRGKEHNWWWREVNERCGFHWKNEWLAKANMGFRRAAATFQAGLRRGSIQSLLWRPGDKVHRRIDKVKDWEEAAATLWERDTQLVAFQGLMQATWKSHSFKLKLNTVSQSWNPRIHVS